MIGQSQLRKRMNLGSRLKIKAEKLPKAKKVNFGNSGFGSGLIGSKKMPKVK